MPEVSMAGFVIVAAVAFTVPLVLGLAPAVRLPAVVLELSAGIIIGPAVLGWVRVDTPLEILSTLGLAFLLFLAGLEVDLHRLRGALLRVTSGGFVASFAVAVVAAYGLGAVGLVESPLLVAIILTATALGVVIPVLKDAGETGSTFGQLLITAASIADFGAVILLSLLFSREATGPAAQLLLLGGMVLFAVSVAVALAGAGRSMRLAAEFMRLQDSSAQIRVRGAVLLLGVCVLVAQRLGLEAILGAFLAGAILRVVDREMSTHPAFRHKLEAIGFGLFVPVFFVTSGLRFDLAALDDASALARVPLFLVALLLARGIPALAYRRRIGTRRTAAAVLLQATSLPFIVAATQIGMEIGSLSAATGAALVAAGLLSLLIFPAAALTLLRGRGGEPEPADQDYRPDVGKTPDPSRSA